jgi:Kdo2-lipid IVA lauroyltransferase/acyltransferase
LKKNNVAKDQKGSSHPLEYFYRLLSICPTRCLFRLARVMAFIVEHTNNQVSRQTTQNIRLCFPDFNHQQQKKLISESVFHTCCAFIEPAFIWNRKVEKVLQKVEVQQLESSFKQSKKARIIVAPHHGSWEILGYWLAQYGELYALYKPARNITIDKYIYEKRSRYGARLVPTNTAGIRQLLKGMKQNASCVILPDQRPGKNMASSDSYFFGQPVRTSLLIKNLASKVDCDIFICAITRDKKKGNYRLKLQSMDVSKILQSDQESANYLNEEIQAFISQDICQYQWSYRRFTDAAYQKLKERL